MAIAVLALAGAARVTAQGFVDDENLLPAFLIDAVGLTAATVLALPWFRLMLSSERNEEVTFPSPSTLGWGAMIGAAIFFWGGVLFAIRYLGALLALGSILVVIWYGFFGFAVADGTSPGFNALGTSVRLGQGRRWTVAVLALILVFLNFVALLPIGAGVNAGTIAAAVVLLAITSNVSMGAGAHMYDWLIKSEGK